MTNPSESNESTEPTEPNGAREPGGPRMHIRRAGERDIPELHRLLRQVADVHHSGRPDLFRADAVKYTDDELASIVRADGTPVLGAFADDDATLLGYAFCVFQRHAGSHVLTDVVTLYVDDLCVDAAVRGRHVGSALYRRVLELARESGCHNVTLNVWSCNPGAREFYERMGLTPYKVGMEQVL